MIRLIELERLIVEIMERQGLDYIDSLDVARQVIELEKSERNTVL